MARINRNNLRCLPRFLPDGYGQKKNWRINIMGIFKRRLAQVLTVSLVVSSLASAGITTSASTVQWDWRKQEMTVSLQENERIASGSDATEQPDKGDLPKEEVGADGIGGKPDNEEVKIQKETELISEIKRNAETSGTCGENLTWSLIDGVLTISGTGEMASYSNSSNNGGTLVPWDESKAEITDVIVENGVTSIGSFAFYDCGNLTSVVLPEGIISINGSAFRDCGGLISLTLPDSIISIGSSAFCGCSGLTSVVLPEGINSIEDNAFAGCSGLTSIILPDFIDSIKSRAFYGCSELN